MAGGRAVTGWFAGVAWRLIHLLCLIGVRRRAAVLRRWTYSEFIYKLGARTVTGVEPTGNRPADQPERPCSHFHTRRASVAPQAWASQPRAWWGASPSTISGRCPRQPSASSRSTLPR